MKNLLLMRHAKSGWDDPFMSDHDRPLNKRGLSDAPKMGKLLKKEKLKPHTIICSPANRAQQTARLVAENSGFNKKIIVEKKLYGGNADDYLSALKQASRKDQHVLLIGHCPDIEHVVEVLTGKRERMPTAAIARIDLDVNDWKEIIDGAKGELVKVFRPKDLKEE